MKADLQLHNSHPDSSSVKKQLLLKGVKMSGMDRRKSSIFFSCLTRDGCPEVIITASSEVAEGRTSALRASALQRTNCRGEGYYSVFWASVLPQELKKCSEPLDLHNHPLRLEELLSGVCSESKIGFFLYKCRKKKFILHCRNTKTFSLINTQKNF